MEEDKCGKGDLAISVMSSKPFDTTARLQITKFVDYFCHEEIRGSDNSGRSKVVK